ncbi:hypothetical protein BZM27_27555 [Paraburkholderia steynii]|uniref:Uncharacterized protein n=1 Tax=Paraburkholderia steynii TaxID=1245441 RepID=A0A4R0X7S4_9BURK|nr:hypothetical protein BZM27_27555 [Paraburkholderia steynii]
MPKKNLRIDDPDLSEARKALMDMMVRLESIALDDTKPDGTVEKVPLLSIVNANFPPGSPMPEPVKLFAMMASIKDDLAAAMIMGGLVLRCWAMANLYIEDHLNTTPDTYRKVVGKTGEIRRDAEWRFQTGETMDEIRKSLAAQYDTSVRVIEDIVPKQPPGRPPRKQARKPRP